MYSKPVFVKLMTIQKRHHKMVSFEIIKWSNIPVRIEQKNRTGRTVRDEQSGTDSPGRTVRDKESAGRTVRGTNSPGRIVRERIVRGRNVLNS